MQDPFRLQTLNLSLRPVEVGPRAFQDVRQLRYRSLVAVPLASMSSVSFLARGLQRLVLACEKFQVLFMRAEVLQ